MVWHTCQYRIELLEQSSQFSNIKKISMFLLTIVTNESNLFWNELKLSWAKTNLFKLFRRLFLRTFCIFIIGCPYDTNVSFKLIEIIDSSVNPNLLTNSWKHFWRPVLFKWVSGWIVWLYLMFFFLICNIKFRNMKYKKKLN